MKTTLKVSGLSSFDDMLGEFSKATARNVMLRAAKDAAEPMAERMRELVHRRSGLTGDSIGVVAIPTTRSAVGKAAYAEAKHAGASDAEAGEAAHAAQAEVSTGGVSVAVAIGPTGDRSHGLAHLEEFGTAHSRPAPFIRPAADETAGEVVEGLAKALSEQIEAAKARAARKAARQAAKG